MLRPELVSIAKLERVHAHEYVAKLRGPELAGILVDVCCHLKGLEAAERDRGWPLRSAKVVLQLGLSSLARHYGFGAVAGRGASPGQVRHWGADNYRPRVNGSPADAGTEEATAG